MARLFLVGEVVCSEPISELVAMWIKSFSIQNLKCFGNTGNHQLDKHVNVVVGQNNAGKTTLLRSLSQDFQCNLHKSSALKRGDPVNPISVLDIHFVASGSEVRNALMQYNIDAYVPIRSEERRVGKE